MTLRAVADGPFVCEIRAGMPQGFGHGAIICAGSGSGFDLVTQDEVGPGVAGVCGGEVFTELGDGGGGAPGW